MAWASEESNRFGILDPSICLVSCGQTGVDDWDRVVIDGLAPFVDLHSIHLYTGSSDYWSNVLAPHFAERTLRATGALIDRTRYLQRIDHEIGVAYDEWYVWYRTDDGRLEEIYTLADALAVATYLNIFVRSSAGSCASQPGTARKCDRSHFHVPERDVRAEHRLPVPAHGGRDA